LQGSRIEAGANECGETWLGNRWGGMRQTLYRRTIGIPSNHSVSRRGRTCRDHGTEVP
jgi:hypothetical protein